MGRGAFVARGRDAGVDGVLVLDLPIEEAGPFRDALATPGIDHDLPAEPDDDRRADPAGGGARQRVSLRHLAARRDRRARRRSPTAPRRWCSASARSTTLPIALGFGISRPEHVAEVGAWADAAVVGSALVNVIAEHGASPDVDRRASRSTCGG